MADTIPAAPASTGSASMGEVVHRNETLEFAAKIAGEPNTTAAEMAKLGEMIRRDAEELYEDLLARGRRR